MLTIATALLWPGKQWVCRAYRNHIARDKAKASILQAIAVDFASGAHDDLSVTGYSHPCMAFLLSLSPHYAMPKRQDWRVDKHAVRSVLHACT